MGISCPQTLFLHNIYSDLRSIRTSTEILVLERTGAVSGTYTYQLGCILTKFRSSLRSVDLLGLLLTSLPLCCSTDAV
jgi:hypothetical protein